MHFEYGKVYHLYNRGNNRQPIFFKPDNYELFKNKITTLIVPDADLLCWCLMTNHFHFLVYTTEASCKERSSFGGKPMQTLAYKIGVLLSSYSQLMNKQNHTTGSLFQQKTKAKLLREDKDIIRCMHYIHQNPYRAGLIKEKWETWPYSSFGAYAGLSRPELCKPEVLFALTGYDPEKFVEDSYRLVEDKEGFY